MKAEELISNYLEGRLRTGGPRKGFVSKPKSVVAKSEYLSADEVAKLKPKQGIIVDGKKARVVQVGTTGSEVSLTYVKGVKSFGPEQTITFRKNDKKTPVRTFSKAYLQDYPMEEEWTNGLKKTVNKLPSRTTCFSCGFKVPRYPGRYPSKCPECGAPLPRFTYR